MVWLAIWGARLAGQPLAPADPQRVLNQHVAFANEALHVLWVLQPALEDLYRRASLATHGVAMPLDFPAHRLLHEELYQGVLLGICTRAGNATDGQRNLRSLYLDLRRGYPDLSHQAQQTLAPARDGLFRSMMELLHRCDSLALVPVASDQRRQLRRIDTLYQQAEQHLLTFHTELDRYHVPMPAELRGLHDLVGQARHSALLLRTGDAAGLAQARDRLVARRAALSQQLANLPDTSALFPVSEHTGYRYLLRYANRIITQLDQALADWETGDRQAQYVALVALLNHQQYGLLAYYNQFLSLAYRPMRRMLELPPWLMLVEPPPPLARLTPWVPVPPALPVPVVSKLRPLRVAPAVHVIALVDVSASMGQGERLTRLQQALDAMIDQLRPGDRLSLLRYAGGVDVLVEAAGPTEAPRLRAAVTRLRTGGNTQLDRGLRQAYRLSKRHQLTPGSNQVLIATDGAVALPPSLQRRVRREAAQARSLSVWLLADKVAPPRMEALRRLTTLGQGQLLLPQDQQVWQRLTTPDP
jgi:hypothetical protein